jgi:hypothetical protein
VRERITKRRHSTDPRKDALITWRTHAARAAGVPEQSVVSDVEIDRILATEAIDIASINTVVGELRGRRLAPRIIDALRSVVHVEGD